MSESCVGCRYLNARYIKGPICLAGTSEPVFDSLTGTNVVTIMRPHEARKDGGICGPERKLYRRNNWFRRIFE